MPRIPHLVFATRSPDPKAGADFVRQIVAESDGVTEQARKEFARRADIAGSVLHREDAKDRLRIFTFNRLDETTWLFARAVSLGIYRKGSHQLLVHGLLLPEEVLDWLEGNPLALDAVGADAGLSFLEDHPGRDATLPPLRLDERLAAPARRHNRERLEKIRAGDDGWLANAYDLLAVDARTACVSRDPRPRTIEELLLHFHPDDRGELSFHTFYTHSRPVDYRLLGVLDSDLAAVRRQFQGLEIVDMAAAETSRRGLGALACRTRRRGPPRYLDLIERVHLTYRSTLRVPPISFEDSAFALDRGAAAKLSPADRTRLDQLILQRSGGGLEYRVRDLAERWRQRGLQPFERALTSAEASIEKIGRGKLDRFLAGHHLDDHGDLRLCDLDDEQRWALVTLLSRDRVLASGAADVRERWSIVRRALPPKRLDDLAAGFSEEQAVSARMILRHWAVADATHGDAADDRELYWPLFLVWQHQRWHRLGDSLELVKNALASRRGEPAGPSAWRRLREVCRRLGHADEAFEIFLDQELPLLEPAAARRAVAREVDWLSIEQPGRLEDLSSSFARPGVAAATFEGLAGRLAERGESGGELWPHLKRCLERATRLDPGSAIDLGRLLAELALLPATSRADVPWTLERCWELVREPGRAFAREALRAAAKTLTAREGRLAVIERPRAIRAITLVLETRGRYGSAGKEDAALMDLGFLGRALAAEMPRNRAEEVAYKLDAAWRTLLNLSRQGSLLREPPVAGRDWLGLLQRQLEDEPPKVAGDEKIELSAFLDLAWALWNQTPPDDPYHPTLAFKLRWALRLGLDETVWGTAWIRREKRMEDLRTKHREWHRRKINMRVLPARQFEAMALLAPFKFSVGSVPPAGFQRA